GHQAAGAMEHLLRDHVRVTAAEKMNDAAVGDRVRHQDGGCLDVSGLRPQHLFDDVVEASKVIAIYGWLMHGSLTVIHCTVRRCPSPVLYHPDPGRHMDLTHKKPVREYSRTGFLRRAYARLTVVPVACTSGRLPATARA